MSKLTIGIDIGASSIKGIVYDCEHLRGCCEVLKLTTEVSKGPRHAVDKILKLVEQLFSSLPHSRSQALALGVATPGPFLYEHGSYQTSPNLVGWDNFDLKSALEAELRLPTFYLNDATAAAVAEKRLGVGVAKENLFLITVGSGIGGGFVAFQQPYLGSGKFARYSTEVGHIAVVDPYDEAARVCSCAQRGHLEGYSSFFAMQNEVLLRLSKSPSLADLSQFLEAKDRGAFMVAEANQGNKFYREIFAQGARYLAVAVATISNTFGPEIVVIGGGASALDDFYVEAVQSHYRELIADSWSEQRELEIVRASLGNSAGALGAAIYGFEALDRRN